MSITSKTGLLPTVKKRNREQEIQRTGTLEMPNLVAPAPFTLKPFAGIYNPFPYGCSILCNHPADFDAKSIVKRAKDAWASEGKFAIDLEELSVLQQSINLKHQTLPSSEEKDDNVPEELFRKYTETDSRPVTPTPTLASIVTRNLRTRRCMTPDPISFLPAKEKTLLVLDLRRSHSQDTVCWPGSLNDANFDNELEEKFNSRSDSPSSKSLIQNKKKKTLRKRTGPSSATTSSLKTQTSKDSDSKTQTQTQLSSVDQSTSKGSLIQGEGTSKNPEIASEGSFGDLNITKRRGKKTKKGKKPGKGEKEFQGIPDPGETQVSALENNSKRNSTETSIEEEKLDDQIEGNLIREPKTEVEENTSFLSWNTLKSLQRQLDQEVVDSELNLQRKIALEEALKHKKDVKRTQQGEEMKNLKKEFQLIIKDSEKWLSIPRVFTRRSSRFEMPMDSRVLKSLTPMEYVQKYVFASPERLVLYNHIFNLYKEDSEDDDERSRTIPGKYVTDALGKIMGREMSTKEANDFRNLLNWKDETNIDFRTFTGISATCERVMSPQFCSKMSSQKEDPRHEIERADFESLEEKLLRLKPDQNLVKILKSVRDV